MKHRLFLLAIAVGSLYAQSGEQTLLVINRDSPVSRQIGDYYRPRRAIPAKNICLIEAPAEEEISWTVYEERVEKPIGACLERTGLREQILYIVLTMGVPLKVDGAGSGAAAEHASVDSELALLYSKLHGRQVPRTGGIPNPFFMKHEARFEHPRFPMYLVARLAAYDWDDVKSMMDRSLVARNRGAFVIDLSSMDNEIGNNWLRTAGLLLPAGRVTLDQTARVLYDLREVIGYASWGSNDVHRKRRQLGFQWLPGAIAMEFVSTDARTLRRPPDAWTFTTWEDKQHWFGGSPQSLSADYIHQGATAATGNAYEPYLGGCARPDYLLPAYWDGRTLGESYYLSVPMLSWQGVLLGDPLTILKK